MKRLLSLTLSFALCCCSWLVALTAAPARAQEVAAAASLDTLRRQYEQMLAVERNAATPPEVRQLNRTFLEERRAQLAAAIRNRIGALDKYRALVAAARGEDERRALDNSIARLSGELRALLPEAVPEAAPPEVAPAEPAPTAPPRSAAPIEAAEGGEEDGEDANQLDAFITSKKAGFAQAGVYLPVNVTGWKNQRELNTLFVAPLAKGGVMTITGDRRTAEAETFGDDDVFNFYSFGVRLGHFRYPRLRRPCSAFPRDENCDSFADYAPELVSWLDITMGGWENFELNVPTGQLDGDGNPITTRQRRWRYQAEGRLKIPETPFLVGFDGNFGQGPDDLRFGFGMRFDVAKLIHRLKLQAMFEEQEARQSDDNDNGSPPEP